MLIRQLSIQSASALQALRAAADVEGTLGRPRERELALTLQHIESQLSAPFETIGAFEGEELVGDASLSRMPMNPFDQEATEWFGVSSVIVHPDFRGQGIGRKLLEECLLRARQYNAKGMLLEVNVPNPAAKSLYDSLGFEVWNVFEGAFNHNGQRFDQISMRKLLSGA